MASQESERIEFTKLITARYLDRGWFYGVKLEMVGLKIKADDIQSENPFLPMLVNYTAFKNLAIKLDELCEHLRVFNRQHQGCIELSDVAIAYQNAEEATLREQLDEYWDMFGWVREQVNDAERRARRL